MNTKHYVFSQLGAGKRQMSATVWNKHV